MNQDKSNLNIENIEFKSDGITLRGKLITPEANINLPVLIMTHGSSATYNMAIIDYAYEISKSGFAVLVYDHPNIGLSEWRPQSRN
jgi:dienelactone hydrolase